MSPMPRSPDPLPNLDVPGAGSDAPALTRVQQQACEGGEMEHDPRGGWRFLQLLPPGRVGSDASPLTFDDVIAPVPAETEQELDVRLRFAGDAGRPPQALAGAGTQIAWGQVPVLREVRARCDEPPCVVPVGPPPPHPEAGTRRASAQDVQRLADDGAPALPPDPPTPAPR